MKKPHNVTSLELHRMQRDLDLAIADLEKIRDEDIARWTELVNTPISK